MLLSLKIFLVCNGRLVVCTDGECKRLRDKAEWKNVGIAMTTTSH